VLRAKKFQKDVIDFGIRLGLYELKGPTTMLEPTKQIQRATTTNFASPCAEAATTCERGPGGRLRT